MRKLLLLFVTVLSTATLFGQACTPDPAYTEAGVYPDSATGLPSGCVGELYDLTITNVVPADTVVVSGWVIYNFDSVVVESFAGLPAGFTYSCYDGQNTISPVDGCAFEGDTKGCIRILGTPATAGTYDLTIETVAYMSPATGTTPAVGPQNVTVDYYKIVIEDCSSAGINDLAADKYIVYPNPASTNLSIEGLSAGNIATIEVFNMNGQKVMTELNNGFNKVDLNIAGLNEGMYFIHLTGENGTTVKKFIKE